MQPGHHTIKSTSDINTYTHFHSTKSCLVITVETLKTHFRYKIKESFEFLVSVQIFIATQVVCIGIVLTLRRVMVLVVMNTRRRYLHVRGYVLQVRRRGRKWSVGDVRAGRRHL